MEGGVLFVVSGPSGAGKTTLINMLLDEFKGELATTVSHTTRRMRDYEIEGVNYYFVDRREFEKMVAAGDFIEYVECFGNLYGTSKMTVENSLEKYNNCIMDVEWEGAYKVLHQPPHQEVFWEAHFQVPHMDFINRGDRKVGIVILPPSIGAVKERLLSRKSETDESLESRVNQSFNGIKNVARYDYIIVNNKLDEAYKTLRRIYIEYTNR
jgi:guanylate kinase